MEEDFIEVGTQTPMMRFGAKIAEVKQRYAKMFKPYDSTCARLEFQDKLDQAEKESERRHGFVKMEELKVDFGDLEKYGDEDRFIFEEDKEEPDFVIVNGIRTSVITGHTLSYRCKARGHGIAVYIPVKEYEEMMQKKKKKGE